LDRGSIKMGYKIEVLYDYRKERPVKVSDIDSDSFDSSKVVEANGNKYRIYSYEGKLIQDEYIHDKKLFYGDLEEMPITLLDNVGGRLEKNIPKITDRLYREYGEGRFLIMRYGGYKDIGSEYKRFIEVIE
jgi:hypothetical protein